MPFDHFVNEMNRQRLEVDSAYNARNIAINAVTHYREHAEKARALLQEGLDLGWAPVEWIEKVTKYFNEE